MNRDRNTLKGFFIKGAIPSQENFADLIDSAINQTDDGIAKLPNDPLRINASGPGETVLNFYQKGDSKPAWVLSLNSGDKSPKAGLNVSSMSGGSRLFIDYKSGNVGIGTTSPLKPLTVTGSAHVEGTIGYFADENKLTLTSGTSTVSDSTADGGIAVERKAGQSSGGMWYGPYVNLPGGNYIVQYRVKVASNASTSAVITLDATSNSGRNSYGSIVVHPTDFRASGDWETFSLPIKIDNNQDGIEFRGLNFNTGITDFYLDYVNVIPGDVRGFVSQQFTVIPNGKVGIGTAAPRRSLDVSGHVVAVNCLTLAQDTGTTKATWHVDNSGGLFRLFSQPNIDQAGTVALQATTDGRLDVYGLLVQHVPVIKCEGKTDWDTNTEHPLRKYFRDKLAGQPRGTMFCVMADSWAEPHYWIGCVNAEDKAYITALKPISKPL
jgi:hypothetical protein